MKACSIVLAPNLYDSRFNRRGSITGGGFTSEPMAALQFSQRVGAFFGNALVWRMQWVAQRAAVAAEPRAGAHDSSDPVDPAALAVALPPTLSP